MGRDFESDVEKLRKRETDIIAFAAKVFQDSPFITSDNFINIDGDFIRSYYCNIPSGEWYYHKEFKSIFAKETEELKISAEISRLEYTEENRQLVCKFINKRYEEFIQLQKTKGSC